MVVTRREFITGALAVLTSQVTPPVFGGERFSTTQASPMGVDSAAVVSRPVEMRPIMLDGGFTIPTPFDPLTHTATRDLAFTPTYSKEGDMCIRMIATEKAGGSNSMSYIAVGRPGNPKEAWRFLDIGINLTTIKEQATAVAHGGHTYVVSNYAGEVEIVMHGEGNSDPKTFILLSSIQDTERKFHSDACADETGLWVLTSSSISQSGDRHMELYHVDNTAHRQSQKIEFTSNSSMQKLFDTGEHIVIISSMENDGAIRTMHKQSGRVQEIPFLFHPDNVFSMPGGDIMMLKRTSHDALTSMRVFIDPQGLPRIRSAIQIDNILQILPSYLNASEIRMDAFSPYSVFHTPDGYGMMVHVTNGVEQAGTRGILFLLVDKEGGFPTGRGHFSSLHSISHRIVAPPVVLKEKCYGVTVDGIGNGDFIIPPTQPLHLPSIQA